MNVEKINQSYYPAIHENDESWGLRVTSAGFQAVKPFESYPPSGHPETHNFNYESGRVLDEFQIIYITKSKGIFSSEHIKSQLLDEGTIFMLFPGEWHTFSPVKETGWEVYWVGFNGDYAANLVSQGYFLPAHPFYPVGHQEMVLALFHQIIEHSEKEKPGYQQLLGGIVYHMLGYIYHFKKNRIFENKAVIPVINKAKLLMRENISNNTGPEDIARMLNISYSWFRQSFKEYTGFSPGQYINNIKVQAAREMLSQTHDSVKQIASNLGFESADYFSVFFKRHAGKSPLGYRSKIQNK